jgi:hypothetical protein
MQKLSLTLQILLAQFDGQILIPFTAAAKVAGFAEQTARNLDAQKKFPIRTQKRGTRRFIHVNDLADYIDLKPKGRPSKALKLKNKEQERA